MDKYCFSCEKIRYFDDSIDSDCLRCSECGSLPYSQDQYFNKLYFNKLDSVIIELNELLNEGNQVMLNRKLSLIIDDLKGGIK